MSALIQFTQFIKVENLVIIMVTAITYICEDFEATNTRHQSQLVAAAKNRTTCASIKFVRSEISQSIISMIFTESLKFIANSNDGNKGQHAHQ